jgi:mRNA interferase RelE/StbE
VAGKILEVRFAPRAERAFLSLPAGDRRRLAPPIEALAQDPRPRGARKLAGEEGLFRIRVGDFRVLYVVRDLELIVLVLDIGHRKDIYRRR